MSSLVHERMIFFVVCHVITSTTIEDDNYQGGMIFELKNSEKQKIRNESLLLNALMQNCCASAKSHSDG
jgi:hypothetical protein